MRSSPLPWLCRASPADGLRRLCSNLGDAIRERIALAGRAKALAAEATLSARVLAALPIVSCIVMYKSNGRTHSN